MRCEFCNQEIPEGEVFEYAGKKVCEDCYIESLSKPKTCDPGAVMAAKASREMQGQQGLDGLMPVQKRIYHFIKEKGKATRDEVTEHAGITSDELERHMAVLRHCELVKGCKIGTSIYLTLFS